MYWTVAGFMGILVLLMLGVSGVCLARELRHHRSLSEMMRALLADGKR
jgi:hypothetical protein